MTKSFVLLSLSIIINLTVSFGQDGMKFQEQFQALVNKASTPIKIDGMLDESSWIEAKAAGDFFMKWPNDIGRPKRKTEIKVTYDNRNRNRN